MPATGTQRETVLDVRNFSVDYGTGAAMVRAVNNVSFTLEALDGARGGR